MLSTSLTLALLLSAQPSTPKPAPTVMYQFLSEVTELQPLFSSSELYKKKENQKKIADALKRMVSLSKNLSSHQDLDDPIFKMTANRVEAHLAEASRNFESGNLDYSRRVFHEALDGCSSCHSQVRKNAQNAWTFDSEKIRGDSFERAEFWYAVRQYEKALGLYEYFVSNYSAAQNPSYRLDVALNRIASTYVRIYLDLNRARDSFSRLAQLENLPLKTRERLQIWAKSADHMAKRGLTREKYKKSSQVETLARNFFQNRTERTDVSDADMVEILFLSGLLYDQVHEKNELNANILYYLAKCEEMMDRDFFLSMSNLYLRRCVVQFPNAPIAEKCYEDLKLKTELSFTGSGGKQVPANVAADLEELKKRWDAQKSQKK